MKHRSTMTLRQRLLKAVVSSVIGTALMGGALYIADQQNGSSDFIVAVPDHGLSEPTAEDRAMRKCRDYAEGTIPEFAVVTLPGQDARYVKSDVAFALWGPDQKFNTADDKPGVIHSFCR